MTSGRSQRIEAGEVIPRSSTLKLIAESLDVDISELNGTSASNKNQQARNLLWISFIAGIIYIVNFIFYMPGFLSDNILIKLQFYFALSIVHMVTAIFLFYGFYVIAVQYKNKVLKAGAILIMITVPLMTIVQHLAGISRFQSSQHLLLLFSIILGISGIIFGIGLLRNKYNSMILYMLAGILQIIISPFFMLPIASINVIGFWLTIPFIVLLLLILFNEQKMLL